MTEKATRRRIAVLGGAGGIGRALIAHLAQKGDDVTVLDLSSSLARHALDTKTIAIDVCDESSIATAFSALGNHWDQVDGFVNLAGYNSALQPLSQTGADYFDEVIAGNLRGVFLAAKAVLPMMAQGSTVVHVASGLAAHVRPGYGAYSASKAGVIALTKTFAVENAPQVRFNVVAPGLVDTAFLRGGTGRSDEDGQSIVPLDAYRAMTPMKRLALPEDIVGPIEFLLSPASGFMTGQVLWVNGGGYMP
ncbi:3-oxoacyl-[acyl-carrier protein] reductase [Neorhizobium galegae]|uniref:SDR family NAD(P)-dependent oxidoreductase n=1 Tax=Neorhizobium galegae TaxID=399 RepID=UPI001AE3BFD8|nr:SDR family oxidoreductase [Neorhizobium galegae]MBP2550838.1 3-oxoacyl-[acyl-carrier protein] reductase [Neorhizobium galegae]